jgi:nicotinamide mononucleotide adenylyltransferase
MINHLALLYITNPTRHRTMGKTALVTGAIGLLGRQVVKAFEHDDWNVKGTGFTRAQPPTTLKVDLTLEEEVAKALDEVK